MTGIRYARVLPVPVPASTIKCRFSCSASSTACAICSCPRRNSYAGCVRDKTPPGAKNWYNEASLPLAAERFAEVEDAGWELKATGVSIIASSGRMHRHISCGDSRGPLSHIKLILTQPTYNSTSTLATTAAGIPTIAIVGRPNVGKSTLFNRIVGSRRAIVGDEPGITRDRLYGDAEWEGRRLRIVDTGGILPEEKDLIPSEIYRQARVALDEAAAIIMVIDGRTELAGPDLELVRLLRKANRPLFLAVNKVDSEKQSSLIDDFHRLGIPKMFPISAEHGRGIDDLLDAVIEVLPEDESSASGASPVEKAPRPRSRKRLESFPYPTDDAETPTTS